MKNLPAGIFYSRQYMSISYDDSEGLISPDRLRDDGWMN